MPSHRAASWAGDVFPVIWSGQHHAESTIAVTVLASEASRKLYNSTAAPQRASADRGAPCRQAGNVTSRLEHRAGQFRA